MSDLSADVLNYISTMGSVSREDVIKAFGEKCVVDSVDFALRKVLANSGRICRVKRLGTFYYQYIPQNKKCNDLKPAVTKENRDEIARLVLNGANLLETAEKFSCLLLTATRQVQNFCRAQNPSHYKVLEQVAALQNRKTPPVNMLVSHKKHFIGN